MGFAGLLIVGAVLAVLTWLRVRRRGEIDLVDWFVLSMAMFICFGTAGVVVLLRDGNVGGIWPGLVARYDGQLWLYAPYALILVVSTWIGAALAERSGRGMGRRATLEFQSGGGALRRGRIAHLAWFLLGLAIVCYWLYARAYGGFGSLYEVGRLVRAGFSPGVENPLTFLQRFGSLAFVAAFLFWALRKLGSERRGRGLMDAVGFVGSFGFSIFVLYTWIGRVGLAVFVLTFPLGKALLRGSTESRLVGRMAIASVVGWALIVGASGLLGLDRATGAFTDFVAQELAFPVASFQAQVVDGTIRWFQDIVQTPLYVLPQQLWASRWGLSTASMFNTELLLGYRKGTGGVTGGIPIDMVTLGQMQAGIGGVVLVGLIWGYSLIRVGQSVIRIFPRGVREIVYAHITLQFAVLSAVYGDPLHIVVRNFHVFVLMIIYVCWSFLFGRAGVGWTEGVRAERSMVNRSKPGGAGAIRSESG